jgi:hypothetical protein
VKKLVVLGAGTLAVAAAALLSPALAQSDPVNANSLNVVGEPYGRAVAILKSQGVKTMFGGATSGELPQSQCIVYQQTVVSNAKMRLMLDCSQKAAEDAAGSMPAGTGPGGPPGPPTVGSNGVTTVTPTPVGPQPGMSIPGA